MNDEMAVRQRGGTRSKLVVERMLNVFDLHFPTPAVEAMSRIYTCKPLCENWNKKGIGEKEIAATS